MDTMAIDRVIQQIPTPFYLFDENALREQVGHVRSLLPGKAILCYAMKANPFVVAQATRSCERIEVCSPGELSICRKLGVPDDKLVISGVYKDPTIMEDLVMDHSRIARFTVESVTQFNLLKRLAETNGRSIALLMRLTGGNQFGMSEAETASCIERCADNRYLECAGIQFFSGTQKTSLKRMRSELQYLDRFVGELNRSLETELREIEYGPGLPALYFEDQDNAEVSEDALICGLGDLLEAMSYRGSIVLELGRSMTANCGLYATRIVDMKSNNTGNYAIVDGGKHQITYYGNSLSMKQPPCRLHPDKPHDELMKWTICGSLCTVNDILVKQIDLRGLQLGDVMTFERAGAYCMTEGLSLFLSRDLPRVIIRDATGNLRIARDRIETSSLNTPSHYLLID